MNLEGYFERIGYRGVPAADAQTLQTLHRAHLQAITYENLDIHLGRTLTLDLGQIYKKIVDEKRGGWCYEMNGLLAWVLREIGFNVQMLASRVGGPAAGGAEDYDHLILLVQLDQPWLVDVGFGNSFVDPLPLREDLNPQEFPYYYLERAGDGWLVRNRASGALDYGFTLQPRNYFDFAARCCWLQTSPESGFVRTTVCHRHIVIDSVDGAAEGILTLRGAVLRTTIRAKEGSVKTEDRIIENQEEYLYVLRQSFDLDFDGAEQLWPGVWQRHLAWVESEDLKQG